jgi:hypothetical protein
MGEAELLIAGLLVAVAGLSAFARRVSIPYPIVLVIGGAVFVLVGLQLRTAVDGLGCYSAASLSGYALAVAPSSSSCASSGSSPCPT